MIFKKNYLFRFVDILIFQYFISPYVDILHALSTNHQISSQNLYVIPTFSSVFVWNKTTNQICNVLSNKFHQWLFKIFDCAIAENYVHISNNASFFEHHEVIKYGRAWSNLS